MDERAHDRGQGPLEADAAGPPAAPTAEPAREEPTREPASAEPPAGRPADAAQAPEAPGGLMLPRAAGGGAGGVGVPVVVSSDMALAGPPEPAERAPPAPAWPPVEPAPEAAASAVGEAPRAASALLVLPQQGKAVDVPAAAADAAELPPAERDAREEAPPPADVEPPPPSLAEVPRPAAVPPPMPPPERLEPAFVPAAVEPPAPAPAHPLPDIWRTEAPPPPSRREALQPGTAPRRLPRITLRRAVTLAAAGLAALAGVVLLLVVLYRWVDPPISTLMLGQRLTGTPITQRWVPLERISPNLVTAVILSEDGAFCRHRGVDWGELREAIESAGDGIARGGSTISMQVVKNLFLWPSRNYVRKAIEIPLTYVIEAAWSKHRILEIYLNIAEWGPGVFGAEAAARHHFRKPAQLLNPREAALLAVSLPNPFDRQAGRPGPGTARLADNLLLRMRAGQGNAACVRARPASG